MDFITACALADGLGLAVLRYNPGDGYRYKVMIKGEGPLDYFNSGCIFYTGQEDNAMAILMVQCFLYGWQERTRAQVEYAGGEQRHVVCLCPDCVQPIPRG